MPNSLARKALISTLLVGAVYVALLAVSPALANVSKNGFGVNGFNSNGFNSNGFNSNGFNSNGFNSNGVLFQCGYASEAARLSDPLNDYVADPPRYDLACLDGQNATLTSFDAHGLNTNGYDLAGYDARGLNKNGWYRPDLRPVPGQDPAQSPLPAASCVPLTAPGGGTVQNPGCARRNTIYEPDACALSNAVVTWPAASVFFGATPPPAVTGFDVTTLPAGAYRCPWDGSFAASGFNSDGFDRDGYDRDGFNRVDFSRSGSHRPVLALNYNYGFVNGAAANGVAGTMDTAGLNLKALEGSLLFGNPAVHNALMRLPLTREHLTNPGMDAADPLRAEHAALYQVWSDPFSIQALLYVWGNAHAGGDDLVYDPCTDTRPGAFKAVHPTAPARCVVQFSGALGLCDRGPVCPGQAGQPCRTAGAPRGWVADQPLKDDLVCQHMVSAVFMAQVNSLGIHNLLSFAGPTPTYDDGNGLRNQLMLTSPVIPVFPFKYGTEQPVEAVGTVCALDNQRGPVNCSWTTAYDGVCTPGGAVTLGLDPATNPKGVPLVLQVQQGIHALNYPFAPLGQCLAGDPYCAAGDFLAAVPLMSLRGDGSYGDPAATAGSAVPSVSFTCPASGVFGVQWAPWDRADYPRLAASAIAFQASGGGAHYPASEVEVFPRKNVEAYWAGNIFQPTDLNPVTTQCEVRLPQAVCGAGEPSATAPSACSSYPAGYWVSHTNSSDPNDPAFAACMLVSNPNSFLGACTLPSDASFYGVCGDTGNGLATRCQSGVTSCCVPCDPATWSTSYRLHSQTQGDGPALAVELQPAARFIVSKGAGGTYSGSYFGGAPVGGHFGARRMHDMGPAGFLSLGALGPVATATQSVAQILVNTTQDDFVLDSVELDGAVSSWSNNVDLASFPYDILSDNYPDPRGLVSGMVMVLPVKPGVVAEGNEPVDLSAAYSAPCNLGNLNSSGCSFLEYFRASDGIDHYTFLGSPEQALGGSVGICSLSFIRCDQRGPAPRAALVPDYTATPLAVGYILNNADQSLGAPCAGDACKQRVVLMPADRLQPLSVAPEQLSQQTDRIPAIRPGQAFAVVLLPTLGPPANPFMPFWTHPPDPTVANLPCVNQQYSGGLCSVSGLRSGVQFALKTSVTTPSTLSNLTSPPYYTGSYVSHSETVGYTGIPHGIPPDYGNGFPQYDERTFDPGVFNVRPEQLSLVVSGHKPAAPSIAFPNAHVWISSTWGDSQGYFQKRACTSDLSTCIANFQGTIDTGPARCAAPAGQSVDALTGLPLGDVGGCNFGNLAGATPAPATFSDGSLINGAVSYPAYGVTTYLPSYHSGPESIANIACTAGQPPKAEAKLLADVCGGAVVVLDASPSSDPQDSALTFRWTEDHGAVAPLSGIKPTFQAPNADTALAFTLVATNLCGAASAPAHVSVVVHSNLNHTPVAGIRGASAAGGVVSLDGSLSFDPDGDPFTYAWTQSAGPAVTLSDFASASPTFAAPAGPATLTFELRVTDRPSQACTAGGGALTSAAAVAQVFVPAVGAIVFTPLTPPPAPAAVSFLAAPVSVAAGLPAAYSFQVSPDPGPGAISATCDGVPAAVTGSANPYAFSCTFTVPGSHEVRVNVAASASGPGASAPYPLLVTDPLPELSVPAPIEVPAEGPSGAVVTFVATASDTAGNTLPVSCTPPSGSTFPVNTGPADSTTVVCSATSVGGATVTQTFQVRVSDHVPPAFAAVAAPALAGQDGVYYTNQQGAAAWLPVPAASDDVGVAGVALIDTLGGVPTETPLAQLGSLSLAEGLHSLVFRATDTSGNRTYSPELLVRVDLTPPAVTVLKPTPNQQFGTTTVTASASILDQSPVAVTLDDGSGARDVTAALDGASHVLTAQITFATSGQKQVVVTATDKAGNTSSSFVALIIDLASPVLSFQAGGQALLAGTAFGPLAGDLLLLTTRVDSTAAGSLTYDFAGAPAQPRAFPALTGLTDLAAVPLVEGRNPIAATAATALYDADGATPLAPRQTLLVTSVLYDKTPPSGAITVPTAGSAVHGLVELTGAAADACPAGMTCPAGGLTGVAAVAFSVDGGPPRAAALTGGVWTASLDTSALAAGPHQVTMTMTDGVGNRATTAPTAFSVEANSPLSVGFLTPTNGMTMPAGTFDVTAEAAGAGVTELTLSTGAASFRCAAPSPAGVLTCTWPDFDFGALCKPKGPSTCPVTFTATARDAAGQSASASLQVAVDQTLKSPLRLIATPRDGATVRGTFQLVTLQAGAGFTRVACTANGSPVGSSNTGKLVARVDTRPLLDGPLAISCTWTDGAGRTDTKTATVQVQNWRLEAEPRVIDLRGCSPAAAPVLLELEGWGNADPPGGATVGALQGPAQAGLLAVHVVAGGTDHSSTLVPATYVSLAASTSERGHPLELRLALDRCQLISAVREALSGRPGKDGDERAVTLQLRQGGVVLDAAALRLKGR